MFSIFVPGAIIGIKKDRNREVNIVSLPEITQCLGDVRVIRVEGGNDNNPGSSSIIELTNSSLVDGGFVLQNLDIITVGEHSVAVVKIAPGHFYVVPPGHELHHVIGNSSYYYPRNYPRR